MHDDRRLIERRIRRALDERIRPAVYAEFAPVDVAAWQVDGEPVPVSEALAAGYAPFEVGQRWGPPWGTTWFRFTGSVPRAWAGRTVELVLDLGFDQVSPGFQAEGLAYRADGAPVKGINPFNAWIPVTDTDLTFYVEAAANPVILDFRHPYRPTLLGDVETAGREPLYRLAMAQLAVFDREVWELVADLEVLDQLMHALSTDSARRWEILRACDR
ncbi:MAG: alpha-mannosidase, partial [Pseudonocardia sp.]|nr:alpha-mannosidase [Pseudonocardia sp.]